MRNRFVRIFLELDWIEISDSTQFFIEKGRKLQSIKVTYVKNVEIRNFFWSVFSFIRTEKYGIKNTPYLPLFTQCQFSILFFSNISFEAFFSL